MRLPANVRYCFFFSLSFVNLFNGSRFQNLTLTSRVNDAITRREMEEKERPSQVYRLGILRSHSSWEIGYGRPLSHLDSNLTFVNLLIRRYFNISRVTGRCNVCIKYRIYFLNQYLDIFAVQFRCFLLDFLLFLDKLATLRPIDRISPASTNRALFRSPSRKRCEIAGRGRGGEEKPAKWMRRPDR